ncbi:hypothetical protein [Catenuloplanes atrovinosus]|uniref:Uncharacterized protein n=1 Tax=Catenuloplanes atrovinosus TaxID=137266 RepID=A0AAE3YUU2_9ACTN|nr:hypothetical protein [Catenuloplanes atrovinosus]MDR7279032.1 hypothetical protein [Catenuloplanes atrovinosus]
MPGNHSDPLTELRAAGAATVERPTLGAAYRGYDTPRPKGGTVDLRIVMHWRHSGKITVDSLGRLAFPVLPDRPGLYRFTWTDSICGHRTFVGETGNLWRRLIAYRHPGPGKISDQYISDLLLTHLNAGGTADVAIAMFGAIHVSGAERELDLASVASRELAANAALMQCAVAGDTDIVG